MVAGHSRSYKRQSRLAFTPLPSSSPAAKEYNKQIQDRAAAVTLQTSPNSSSRRRKRRLEMDGANESIPTPAASREQIRQVESESDEQVRSTQRRSSTQANKRARQQRLDFSNIRDADSFSPPQKLSSPPRPQSTAQNGMFGGRRHKRVFDISSDDEVADTAGDQIDEQGSDEELPSPSKLRSLRGSKGTTTKEAQAQHVTLNSDSESDAIQVSSSKRPVIIESKEEDDDMPTTAGTQRRKPGKRRSNSFIASPSPRVPSSDDDIEILEQPKKRKRKAQDESDDEEEAEASDNMNTPSRGKLKRRRQRSRQEQDELAEDLDFLEPNSDIDSPRKKRGKLGKKSAREQALDQLRRRRSKHAVEPEEENEAEDDEEGTNNDEHSQDDEGDIEDEYILATKSSQMFREDEYDEGFVASASEENDLGIPDGVPLEFTRYASMKAKELFKHAVEWFVQKKINPAFSMEDAIYRLTFRKLNDEVDGLASSKFKSAAWTPEFTMVLNARPNLAFEQVGVDWMRDSCDACNRSGHPATFQIQFQGKPYHPRTLEHVAGNDDEDDSSSEDDEDDSSSEDDNGEEPAYDANGHEIPPESTIYYVGKFCMSNARTAHSLQHWRYHLNQWIITWLEENGYLAPAKIVERDRWSTKKRRRYANKIADKLEQEGLVKSLYGDYKRNIDEARDSKQGRYSGWD